MTISFAVIIISLIFPTFLFSNNSCLILEFCIGYKQLGKKANKKKMKELVHIIITPKLILEN